MLALLSAWAALAGPPEPGLAVQWDAPAGCPDGAAVRGRVVRLVGEEAAQKARLTARGAVRAEGGRWALVLELSGETGSGRRSLAAARCEELAGAAALVIAIAVDPRAALAGAAEGGVAPGTGAGGEDVAGGTGGAPEAPGGGSAGAGGAAPGGRDVAGGTGVVPEPGGPAGAEGANVAGGTGAAPGKAGVAAGPGGANGSGSGDSGQGGKDMTSGTSRGAPGGAGVADGGPRVGAPTAVREEVVEETGSNRQGEKSRSRVRFAVRAAAGVGFARILPGPSAALGLTLSAAGKGWRAELGGIYAPPVVGGSAQIGGVFQLGAVELRGCPALRRGRLEVPLCVGLQVGAMQGRGRGSGLTARYTARSLWLAASLGAALAWRPRERFGLWLQVDAIAALVRPSFMTVGGVTVHEAARLGGQALAGVEVRLR